MVYKKADYDNFLKLLTQDEINYYRHLKGMIIINYNNNKKLLNFIKSIVYNFGFFISKVNDKEIIVEPYLSKDVKINRKVVYHVSKYDNLDDILKNGILPRNDRDDIYYPKRVYFVTDKNDALNFIKENDNYNEEKLNRYVIFTIKNGCIKNAYIDPNYGDDLFDIAYYTYDKINKDCILSYDIIHLNLDDYEYETVYTQYLK